MAEHELKTWPNFFQAILRGDKAFEIRRDDRGFAVGDVLILREFDPNARYGGAYTGGEQKVGVTFILEGDRWGVKEGFVVMGIKLIPSPTTPVPPLSTV